ncbi:MAG TPA: phosphatase PAP2 family protein [Planctomycetia bacterium]|jgi:membrane-associated phospholipid phosphatase|nr:phosphatase PAP2 family protein [Planctomycetia bacterium]
MPSGWRKAIIAVVALAVCFWWADGALYRFLHSYFNVNTRPVPYGMAFPHRVLRSAEDWGENVYIILVLFAMWKLDRRKRSRVFCVVVAALAATGVVEVLKRTIGRERPTLSEGRFVAHGLNSAGVSQSFPSGHTASAAAYSGAIASFYPPVRSACFAIAVGCGANRIWKERHYLSDCLVGGWIGWAMARWMATGRRFRPFWDALDDRISVRPPPPALISPWSAKAA